MVSNIGEFDKHSAVVSTLLFIFQYFMVKYFTISTCYDRINSNKFMIIRLRVARIMNLYIRIKLTCAVLSSRVHETAGS